MREIVLDTETTGLDPRKGDRIIEVACVELEHHLPTGRHLHFYCNPGRDVPIEATNVHGLTTEFVKQFPPFEHYIQEFMDFIADSPSVIHNAAFDMKFLNFEVGRLGYPAFAEGRAIDTLLIARKKSPKSPASLDALCRRFKIDLSKRDKHGALIDTGLLAEVYLELIGGRAPIFLGLEEAKEEKKKIVTPKITIARKKMGLVRQRELPIPSYLSDQDKEDHLNLLKTLKGEIMWLKN